MRDLYPRGQRSDCFFSSHQNIYQSFACRHTELKGWRFFLQLKSSIQYRGPSPSVSLAGCKGNTEGVATLGSASYSILARDHNETPFPFLAAGVSLSLVPFTLNFTITSLRYTEDMGLPGSELFSTTERTLNRLVRPPLMPTLQCLLLSCPAPWPIYLHPCLSSPAQTLIPEQQYWAPL